MCGPTYLKAGAELAARHEHVDVVGAHEILRHVDDSHSQRLLAVVVRGVLCNVAAAKNPSAAVKVKCSRTCACDAHVQKFAAFLRYIRKNKTLAP